LVSGFDSLPVSKTGFNMTCIVGVIDRARKCVVIGGDSAAIGDNSVIIRKDPKVFFNGEFLIGCTTSFRMINLLRFSFVPPEIKTKDIYRYMCTDFVDEARRCFVNGGYLMKGDHGDDRGGTFLVGYHDRLFEISEDFQVAESASGYGSVGCGSDFALGALYILIKNKTYSDSRLLVKQALSAAECYSTGVQGPFTILSTKTKK
jgi:ATP-dependent protease HslVU (ClpYQ) peptidase subunit